MGGFVSLPVIVNFVVLRQLQFREVDVARSTYVPFWPSVDVVVLCLSRRAKTTASVVVNSILREVVIAVGHRGFSRSRSCRCSRAKMPTTVVSLRVISESFKGSFRTAFGEHIRRSSSCSVSVAFVVNVSVKQRERKINGVLSYHIVTYSWSAQLSARTNDRMRERSRLASPV